MVPNRFTVILDANVLFSALQRNVALTLAESGFFRPRWSSTVLDELERNLAGRIGEEKAAKQRARIERAFPEGLVGLDGPKEIAPQLPDPDDRHVLAAAIGAKAAQIVTWNLKHFPPAALEPFEIEAVTPDELFSNTIELSETTAVAALSRMRKRLANPAFDADALILRMEQQGLSQTASILADFRELL